MIIVSIVVLIHFLLGQLDISFGAVALHEKNGACNKKTRFEIFIPDIVSQCREKVYLCA